MRHPVTNLRTPDRTSVKQPFKIAYFVSHPIQYQAALLRRVAMDGDFDLKAFFMSDLSVRGYHDREFGLTVKWDIPLLEGYQHEFLPLVLADQEGIGPLRPLNRSILSRLISGKFDAVWIHGYSTVNSIFAILAARLLGVPVFVRVDSTLLGGNRSTLKKLARRAFFAAIRPCITGVLTTGTANAKYWTACLGKDIPQYLMPYAVDNAFFQKQAHAAMGKRGESLRSLGLDANRPTILFASKLIAKKRCSDLIESHRRLEENAGGIGANLIIVGDGKLRTALEAQARATRSGAVRFVGFQNQTELSRYFDLCDVFVLPSDFEPWGLVVNEVMNSGRPVIVSDQVGCHFDLVRHGENGLVFKAGDVEALTNALFRVLRDSEVSRRMGARSLEIIQSWGLDENVEGLKLALREALHDRHLRTTSGLSRVAGS